MMTRQDWNTLKIDDPKAAILTACKTMTAARAGAFAGYCAGLVDHGEPLWSVSKERMAVMVAHQQARLVCWLRLYPHYAYAVAIVAAEVRRMTGLHYHAKIWTWLDNELFGG
jgi:hypothetical protein